MNTLAAPVNENDARKDNKVSKTKGDAKVTLKQSVAIESLPNTGGNQGMNPSKKTKGNAGASKGGTTMRAGRGRARKGKGHVCPPPLSYTRIC